MISYFKLTKEKMVFLNNQEKAHQVFKLKKIHNFLNLAFALILP